MGKKTSSKGLYKASRREDGRLQVACVVFGAGMDLVNAKAEALAKAKADDLDIEFASDAIYFYARPKRA